MALMLSQYNSCLVELPLVLDLDDGPGAVESPGLVHPALLAYEIFFPETALSILVTQLESDVLVAHSPQVFGSPNNVNYQCLHTSS
ncbi:hypothetical protein HAX54_001971 [Datura stramonium]|uniref:Uncharacterized protein n=1 Tax=Datura stramonium TaxID=4076 RepID=A0ABS8T3T3_DATST|nr:hypothetical protein [Datura stramonium]